MWKPIYQFTKKDDKLLQQFSEKVEKSFGLSKEFSRLLWARGNRNEEFIEKLTQEDFPEIFTYYKELFDADRAAEIILGAVKSKEKIFIYGDYDVDGITSTSLLWRFLYHELGADVIPFVPHREREGYGLNIDAISEMIGDYKGEMLLITVDTGIKDNQLITSLKKEYPNLKVIVTDHHQFADDSDPNNPVPEAEAIVHPLHNKSRLEDKEICACAVIWAVICAMRDKLGKERTGSGIELAALATVCDVMPMTGLNRKIVKTGLRQFTKSKIPGVRALMQVARIKPSEIEAYHMGYILGPRVNAAGRIGEPIDAVRMFCTESNTTAQNYAEKLNSLNQQRQDATNTALIKVEGLLSEEIENLIFVHDPDWEEGVVGLIAGKLQEKYGRPSIAATRKADGTWVGSARSNEKIDITGILSKQADLLVRFGGHVQAAGFNVTDANLKQLIKNLQTHASENIHKNLLTREINYDLAFNLDEFPEHLIDELKILEPFGQGNFAPKFLFTNLYPTSHRIFGSDNKHISFKFKTNLEGIWFNHNFPIEGIDKAHDFIASLGYNEWQGRKTPQLKIKHHRLWQN